MLILILQKKLSSKIGIREDDITFVEINPHKGMVKKLFALRWIMFSTYILNLNYVERIWENEILKPKPKLHHKKNCLRRWRKSINLSKKVSYIEYVKGCAKMDVAQHRVKVKELSLHIELILLVIILFQNIIGSISEG